MTRTTGRDASATAQVQASWSPTRITQAIAVILFALAAVVVLAVPLVNSSSETTSSDGSSTSTTVESTALRLGASQGWAFAVTIAVVPLLFAVVPLLLRGHAHAIATIVGAVLAVGWSLVSIFTVGVLFLPGAMTLVVAAVLLAAPARRHGSS